MSRRFSGGAGLVVAPGEYLVVRTVQAATATDHYIINVMWEELS